MVKLLKISNPFASSRFLRQEQETYDELISSRNLMIELGKSNDNNYGWQNFVSFILYTYKHIYIYIHTNVYIYIHIYGSLNGTWSRMEAHVEVIDCRMCFRDPWLHHNELCSLKHRFMHSLVGRDMPATRSLSRCACQALCTHIWPVPIPCQNALSFVIFCPQFGNQINPW